MAGRRSNMDWRVSNLAVAMVLFFASMEPVLADDVSAVKPVKEYRTEADYVRDIPEYRATLLEAEMARPVDKKLVAKRCFELANLLVYDRDVSSFRERKKLYWRAISLTDKTDTEYATYVASWSGLSPGAERRHVLKKWRVAESEKEKLSYCTQLASEAAQRNQWQSSLHWCGEACDHYLRADDDASGFFPYYGLIYFDCLVGHGCANSVEKFLRASLSKAEELRPNDKVKIAGMNYLLFAFLLKQNRGDECTYYLDRALQCDLTTGFERYSMTCWVLPSVPHDGAAMAAEIISLCKKIQDTNPQLAKLLLNKLLVAQQKVLANDSLGVSFTKEALEAVK